MRINLTVQVHYLDFLRFRLFLKLGHRLIRSLLDTVFICAHPQLCQQQWQAMTMLVLIQGGIMLGAVLILVVLLLLLDALRMVPLGNRKNER